LGARSRKVGGGRRPDSLPTPVLVLLAPGGCARLAAAIIFVGFNLTFFPQYILGDLGMPRRFAAACWPPTPRKHLHPSMARFILGAEGNHLQGATAALGEENSNRRRLVDWI
jgi:hypothetical protein